jgi:RNA polymerase sigma factor (sigma-70 family)
MSDDDSALLRRYTDEKSEEAFAALVRRHLDLVYSVALRQVNGDAHLAQDVAQAVFTALARKAATLAGRPVLGGWLYRTAQFTAIDRVRTESRRRTREREAQTMDYLNTTPVGAIDWDQLRPTLDRAIGELDEDDRDAVVLRFFEGKSFADVGAKLRLTENTARMRVERALDKLHALLARHGVTSTAAALGAALANQPSIAAPAGLAATVTGAALAGSWVTGAGAAGGGLIAFMASSKLILGGTAAAAVLGFGAAFYQTRAVHRRDAAAASVAVEQATLAAKVRDLETRVATEARRAQAADDDNAKLLKVIEGMKAAQAARVAEPPAAAEATGPVTKEMVDARYKHAQELARNGNWEAALPELLWCYDEGMVRVSSYTGVRSSFLLSEMMKLASNYPPALAALKVRRDRAEQMMLANAGDRQAAMDFASLNSTLGDDARNLEAFDKLPAGDSRRAGLLVRVYDQLITAQRYADAAAARPFAQMNQRFDQSAQERPLPPGIQNPDMLRKANRSYVVTTTAKDIEVLAGAGDLDRARTLTGKLLVYDGSEATKTIVQQHLKRAGHPELLSSPTP